MGNFIATTQSPTGQFYTDLTKKKTTLEGISFKTTIIHHLASLHSVAALYNLQKSSKGKNIFNLESLYHSVKSAGRDAHSTAQAGLIVSLAKGFSSLFHKLIYNHNKFEE